MSDSSIVITQFTVGLYTVAIRCTETCFGVTLKYTDRFISYNTSTPFATYVETDDMCGESPSHDH